jgi:homoserine dehydrogenase
MPFALAQAQGFAEENPTRDLSGQDSADKLALMIEAAFGEWLDPGHIETRGINTITDDPTGYKLIARAKKLAGRRLCGTALGRQRSTGAAGGFEFSRPSQWPREPPGDRA